MFHKWLLLLSFPLMIAASAWALDWSMKNLRLIKGNPKKRSSSSISRGLSCERAASPSLPAAAARDVLKNHSESAAAENYFFIISSSLIYSNFLPPFFNNNLGRLTRAKKRSNALCSYLPRDCLPPALWQFSEHTVEWVQNYSFV
jgi:hypothetical protein